jgi:hypothetical protein
VVRPPRAAESKLHQNRAAKMNVLNKQLDFLRLKDFQLLRTLERNSMTILTFSRGGYCNYWLRAPQKTATASADRHKVYYICIFIYIMLISFGTINHCNNTPLGI